MKISPSKKSATGLGLALATLGAIGVAIGLSARPAMLVATISLFLLVGVSVAAAFAHRRSQAQIAQLQESLALQKSQLASAQKEFETFCYSVSHDLRAPLRHIDGFTGLLQKKITSNLDETSRRHMVLISDAARQMGRLIDDLLAFSRIGRTDLCKRDIDHDALLTAVLQDDRLRPPGAPIDWIRTPLPRVKADAVLLRQAWFELIDNAVKYSGKSPSPCIEIGSRTDLPTSTHIFYVRDNGIGFDMRYADKIFGVFQRLHSPTDFEGTGIGLANVHRVISRHGGRTWANSTPGQGATFYFSLPQ